MSLVLSSLGLAPVVRRLLCTPRYAATTRARGPRLWPRSCYSNVNFKAKLTVTPSAAFIDEQLSICVSGLQNLSKVTIRAFVEERGRKFESYAQFIPDGNGEVEVDSQPSIHGSYKGTRPMGLFTHMAPSPGQQLGLRLIKKDVTTPLVFYLTVYEGFLSTEDFYSENTSHTVLANTTVERWYMAKDVDRIEVRNGNIRGVLFKPKGNGPFPGILDMFGAAGGVIEFRAALLASYGFATFSLAYFRYDDLPDDHRKVDMVYFEEAVDWMLSNPFVMDSGIGTIGVSSGAQTLMKLSIICAPKIKATICINGAACYTHEEPARLYKGQYHDKTLVSSMENTVVEDGIVDITAFWPNKREDVDPATIMNIEDASCEYLFIVGEDDKSWSSLMYSEIACEHLTKHGKDNWELLSYPGAGHLIEPAYAPLCSLCYFDYFGIVIKYGGFPDEHSFAQEDSWRKTLEFFKKHVGTNEPIRTLPSHDRLGVTMIQSKL